MISQREVIRRYNKMLKNIDKEGFNNRYKKTAYICKTCGNITMTISYSNGAIPFKILCPKCKTYTSTSNSEISNDIAPSLAWYRPDIKKILKLRKYPNELEHILNGGLIHKII